MSSPDLLAPLRAHPVFQLADVLAAYLGVQRDLIQFIEFLSLAAGRMVMPISLDVHSDNLTIDLHTANRILDLRHDHVARVDTHRDFRDLERRGFHLPPPARNSYGKDPPSNPRPLSAILIRGNHRFLHRDVTEYTARMLGSDFALPSLWRIADVSAPLPPVPSTLRLQTGLTARGLDEFGCEFCVYRAKGEETVLATIVEALPFQPVFSNPLRTQYRDTLPPERALVFERLVQVIVALRIQVPGAHSRKPEVLLDDYSAARALALALPLMPVDRQVSPQALTSAERIFAGVNDPNFQLELPDQSLQGHKWFSRRDAVTWTGWAYNTVKNQLRELENEGILQTTVAESNRERGRQIHYRFGAGHSPPFAWKNPFELLPDLAASSTP
jgi:hypothetical protein